MSKMKKAFCWILDALSWMLILMNFPAIILLMGLAYVASPIRRFCINLATSRLYIWMALRALNKYLRNGSDFSDSYNDISYDVIMGLWDILESEDEA